MRIFLCVLVIFSLMETFAFDRQGFVQFCQNPKTLAQVQTLSYLKKISNSNNCQNVFEKQKTQIEKYKGLDFEDEKTLFSLYFLKFFPSLKTLHVDGKSVVEYESLKELTALQGISLYSAKMKEALDLNFLKRNKDLYFLSIRGKVINVEELHSLSLLEVLRISHPQFEGNPKIDLTRLKNLLRFSTSGFRLNNFILPNQLEEIYTEGTVRGGEFLKNKPKLKELHLTYGGFETKAPYKYLENLSSLEVLTISPAFFSYNNFDTPVDLTFLKNSSKLKSLTLKGGGYKSLKGLENFKDLENLFLGQLPYVKNTGDLSKLKKLKEIELFQMASLANLEGLPKALEKLNFEHFYDWDFDEVEPDLSAVKDLPNLKVLNLSGHNISNLDFLKSSTKLVSLDLDFIETPSLEALSRLKNLKRLSLNNVAGYKDIGPLSKLYNLRYLDLKREDSHDHPRLKDLSALRGLIYLEYLDVSHHDIRSLTPLMSAGNLKELILDGNENLENLNGAQYFTNLTKMSFQCDDESGKPCQTPRLSNLEEIKDLVFLEELTLTNSKVKDFSPLKNLKSLRSLNLKGNDLSSFKLENFPFLGSINLEGNDISSLTLKDLPVLEELEAKYNSFDSLKFVDLPNLKTIEIRNGISKDCYINEFHYQGLYLLEELVFDNCYLTGLSFDFRGMKNLKKLSLGYGFEKVIFDQNHFLEELRLETGEYPYETLTNRDLEKFKMLSGAEKLYVYVRGNNNNQISSLESIAHWSGVEELKLYFSQINDLSLISHWEELERIDLRKTPVARNRTPENCPQNAASEALRDFCTN